MSFRRFFAFSVLCSTLAIVGYAQPVSASEEGFSEWVSTLRSDVVKEGISLDTVRSSLSDVDYLPRVIELDRKQPEGRMTFAEYRSKIVSPDRIQKGREMMRKHSALLDEVSAHYGVAPQYIVALWGIETSYGRITGNFDIIDALATLAYDGRRGEFFRSELIKALKIIDQGHITKAAMKGSWAGAMGQNQFMPSSFLAYAEDFDKDGRRDIWGTQKDVFASSSNYLKQSGWQEGERWGRAVQLPKDFDAALIEGRANKRPLSEWSRLGVRKLGGGDIPVVDGMMAGLVAPDGYPGPVFLTYSNYDVIMKWNRSTYFATSVGLLADAIADAGRM